MSELLQINDLFVKYETDEATVNAVNGISLTVNEGEAMGIVGETGAGKTTMALSILQILPEQVGKISCGEIIYKGRDICKLKNKDMLRLRGKSISMIFQDPMTSLNPIITVGDQIMEMVNLHFPTLSTNEKVQKVINILNLVGIPSDRRNEYPFQFSGGMKQRVGIAMALICEPELLIADEPTTALDVTIQAQILELMRNLKEEFNTSMIMITHDLGIVAETCDKVSIVYAGEIVETGTIEDVFTRENNHPYTKGLFNCIPKLDSYEKRLSPIEGFIVDPTNLPGGCKFHERCANAMKICSEQCPPVYQNGTHCIKCFLYDKWENGEAKNE